MHQILFAVPWTSIRIFSFGAMMVVAVLCSYELARWRAKREGLDPEQVGDMAFFVILAGLVGARAFYVWEVWGKKGMTTIGDMFAIWNGGIVLYGSLLGAAVGFAIYRLLRPMPILRTLDVCAPSLALGAAFGRIGCFLNGCCYGDRCSLPWAVSFPQKSIPWWDHVEHHWISEGAARSLPVHPTQLYSAFDAFLLVALLTAFFPLKKRDGEVMALLLITYPLSRFLIERLRDDDGIFAIGMTISQTISVGLLIGGIVFWVWLRLCTPAKRAEAAIMA
jgi:phosphatidylglycerol:prolipoprotein diacylglycerol transferase